MDELDRAIVNRLQGGFPLLGLRVDFGLFRLSGFLRGEFFLKRHDFGL